MTNFELWVKGCKMNEYMIYRLEYNNGNGLYETKKLILVDHKNYYTTPMFHIWVNDEHEVCNDYIRAYNLYMRRISE